MIAEPTTPTDDDGPVQELPAGALRRFLEETFTAEKLRSLVGTEYARVGARVRWQASLEVITYDVVTTLQRENLIDAELFRLLAREQPGQSHYVRELGKAFGIPDSPATAKPAPPSPTLVSHAAPSTSRATPRQTSTIRTTATAAFNHSRTNQKNDDRTESPYHDHVWVRWPALSGVLALLFWFLLTSGFLHLKKPDDDRAFLSVANDLVLHASLWLTSLGALAVAACHYFIAYTCADLISRSTELLNGMNRKWGAIVTSTIFVAMLTMTIRNWRYVVANKILWWSAAVHWLLPLFVAAFYYLLVLGPVLRGIFALALRIEVLTRQARHWLEEDKEQAEVLARQLGGAVASVALVSSVSLLGLTAAIVERNNEITSNMLLGSMLHVAVQAMILIRPLAVLTPAMSASRARSVARALDHRDRREASMKPASPLNRLGAVMAIMTIVASIAQFLIANSVVALANAPAGTSSRRSEASSNCGPKNGAMFGQYVASESSMTRARV